MEMEKVNSDQLKNSSSWRAMEMEKKISDLVKNQFRKIRRFNDKDATIKEMEKLVDDLREKLKILEVQISEKDNLLETAEKKIEELTAESKKPQDILLHLIKRIFQTLIKGASTSKVQQRSISNGTSTDARPQVPVAPTGRKLILFNEGDRARYDLLGLLRGHAEVLGYGTFGDTFKTSIVSGEIFVVKRLEQVTVTEKKFRENIARIGELKHNNIVPLLAYCRTKEETLVVCDFLRNGSLSAALLYGNILGRAQLNWKTRTKIIISISNAIKYIHSMGPASCHGNIKSSNVLLHPTYVACLSDTGLYSLTDICSPHSSCYRAPEITDLGKMSQKADVYSFGMLVMELLTGKNPTLEILNEDGVNLVRSFESVDESLKLVRDQSARMEMMRLMQLALNCMDDNPVNRPTMADVVVTIEGVLKINDS